MLTVNDLSRTFQMISKNLFGNGFNYGRVTDRAPTLEMYGSYVGEGLMQINK